MSTLISFKNHFRTTSRLHSTEMSETITRLDVTQKISRSIASEKVTEIRGLRKEAFLNDTARLVGGSPFNAVHNLKGVI